MAEQRGPDVQGPFGVVRIMEILPHRHPFLLVDGIECIDPTGVTGFKNVTITEPFFPGHFPGRPIMPGVLILEGMAQCGGVWAASTHPMTDGQWVPNLTGVDRVKFRRRVEPGDRLLYDLRATKSRQSSTLRLWRFDGTASVDGSIVCQAKLTAAFVRMDGGDAAEETPR